VAIHLPGGVVPVITMITVAHAGLAFAAAPAEAVIASVTPHRLRGMGFAMRGVYGAVGGIAGAVLLGLFADTWGERTALTVALPPACLVAGAIIAIASRHIRRDLALVVSELRDDLAEQERRRDPERVVPLLHVAKLDVSYGKLQVLFGVDLDVQPGEILALLGTNGAGKSTLLRAISGLTPPDRGTVRWDGELISFTTAEERVTRGIIQVRGGKGVFPSLTVRENLIAAGYRTIWRRDETAERAGRALELFPRLSERLDQPAGSLSGGEQQMLGIAQALMHEPRLLLIDELSLGLAPVVVHELLDVVAELRAQGITFVIVEQSLNIALAVADRAVFLEKGHVRFTGSATELRERDDLARAVFLGGRGEA
jgi:ABC-type branched-subunit amino acid transport system ATPase component